MTVMPRGEQNGEDNDSINTDDVEDALLEPTGKDAAYVRALAPSPIGERTLDRALDRS